MHSLPNLGRVAPAGYSCVMFGIGGGEFLTLVILAVVLFGPEKIPEFSRKAARVVHYLRNVANNATTQLRTELGPEYADLELKDLTPKAILQRALLDDMQADLAEIKTDLDSVKAELGTTGAELDSSVKGSLAAAGAVVASGSSAAPLPPVGVDRSAPFDPEAT